ncbi:MAG: inositol-3-phosphate synthase [Candidatus Woesearchaeota archaeon]
MGKINVAIVGVGNCASSLVQGVEYYKKAKLEGKKVPGLMHPLLGGYTVEDITFVAAFDINKTKVGKDLSEAIFAYPNTAYKSSDVPNLEVMVERGMTHDGIGKYAQGIIIPVEGPTADIVGILRGRKADVVINYLPVGTEEGTKWYTEQILQAGCGMINCIPVFLAGDGHGHLNQYWAARFERAGLPIIGDDIKSQVGATIVHRALTRLFFERGAEIEDTYQLNVGGDMDFKNMLEHGRLESKRISKTGAVQSQLDVPLEPDKIHIGPSDFVSHLGGQKVCYINMNAQIFSGAPIELEVKLTVWDSPNSGGVVIDAIRCAKLALDRHVGGALTSPSSYFMKSPPIQYTDPIAREKLEQFIAGKLER